MKVCCCEDAIPAPYRRTWRRYGAGIASSQQLHSLKTHDTPRPRAVPATPPSVTELRNFVDELSHKTAAVNRGEAAAGDNGGSEAAVRRQVARAQNCASNRSTSAPRSAKWEEMHDENAENAKIRNFLLFIRLIAKIGSSKPAISFGEGSILAQNCPLYPHAFS